MATETTPRKIAIVTGPSWWGDNWAVRSGVRVRGRDREMHALRIAEAAAEAAGLVAELDRLTAGVSLLLVGTSGATRLASRWADDHERLTLRVPATAGQVEEAEALAVEVAFAMAAAGRLVRALVCVTEPGDPSVESLRARGLDVRPVLPMFPEPEATSEGEPATTPAAKV